MGSFDRLDRIVGLAPDTMPLKDLPPETRPREKLLARGAAALADAELLALLLRTGTPQRDVLQLSAHLLEGFGGLSGLLALPTEALAKVKGLGKAKRAELAAVLELARRAIAEQLHAKPVFDSPAAVREYLRLQLATLDHEVFAVLFLDAQHRLLAFETLFRGSLTQASVYPREVVKRALALNAAAVILAHNHPSGVAEPSRADEFLTKTLRAALALIDVQVLDHVVVASGGSVSFADRGLL